MYLLDGVWVFSHLISLLCAVLQIPGEMLRQIRYLYDNEVRRLNQRSVQRAIKQMQNELMDQPGKGITIPEVSVVASPWQLISLVCISALCDYPPPLHYCVIFGKLL